MRDQNPVLLSGKFQQDRVRFSAQASFLDIKYVDCRLTRPETIDDMRVEILRFEGICRRAASWRAKRSGFVWLRGIADCSSSRSPSLQLQRWKRLSDFLRRGALREPNYYGVKGTPVPAT